MDKKEQEKFLRQLSAGIGGMFEGLAVFMCCVLIFGAIVIGVIIYAIFKTK